jgi:hypothetical protein
VFDAALELGPVTRWQGRIQGFAHGFGRSAQARSAFALILRGRKPRKGLECFHRAEPALPLQRGPQTCFKQRSGVIDITSAQGDLSLQP